MLMKPKTKLTIALDVDGVLANLVQRVLDWYNQDCRDTVRHEDITDWDISKFVKPDSKDYIYSLLGTGYIYETVRPYPFAWDLVANLRHLGHRVVFVTTPFKGTEGRKLQWLVNHKMLKDSADYMEAHDKSLVRADILLDDGIHNLRAFAPFGQAWMMEQPWNKRHGHYPRVASLPEFYNAIKKLTK